MPQEISIEFGNYEAQHLSNIDQYQDVVDQIYQEAAREAAKLGKSVKNFDAKKPFTFADYPQIKARIDKLLKNLSKAVTKTIEQATYAEWLAAMKNNDDIVDKVFSNTSIPKVRLGQYYQQNLKAYDAFQKRKINGFSLSDRVWNLTGQYRQELEMAIDIGLLDGRSAAKLSQDIRGYLNDPDKLFRRVRNARGQLQLSKNALSYHPGQGVYRSSYKNALRLARNEPNMAYRAADFTRWGQIDFILGYEVKLSNAHRIYDICDLLQGRYPKTFKFVGWHPQCFCFVVPILANQEEFLAFQNKILAGDDVSDFAFSGKIEWLPGNFVSWAKDNYKRAAAAKHTPYFISDNLQKGNIYQSALSWKANRAQSSMGLLEKEAYIRNNKTFETAVAFDRNGIALFEKAGGATSVQFTPEELAPLRDCVFTHNHPIGWRSAADKMGRIGNSFSLADVSLAIQYNFSEIRAVTPNFTFSMKRPAGGWPALAQAQTTMIGIHEKLVKDMAYRISQNTTTVGKAQIIHQHKLWQEFAKQFKLEYSKFKAI